ncbi:MAG TPA: AAA family ATPase [Streptosporangiaceae bacterium]|nr:AAA family ATPase [Streptosporangiaceae bacterium]
MRSMLCPTLIERDAEVHALDSGLDRAMNGEGGVLFLAGDAGVGKSRLAREATSLASARGFNVLIGRSTESTVPVPFRPITEALMKIARAGVVPDDPQLAIHLPVLASLVPEWSRPGDDQAEISPLILGEALIRLLTPSGSKGTLLVLEDLHWADPETLAIIEYLADNLAETSVLCVATVRDTEPSAGLDLLRSITARRAATCLQVTRLGDEAVRRMAAACLDTQELPGAVTRLLADCDGLPFAVEEMLATAVSSGQLVSGASGWQVDDRVSTSVPASIAGSVRNRLAALGPVVSDVLASAAVLGRKFNWTLLPSITDLTEPQVLAALQQAQAMQLITPIGSGNNLFRFRHSLTRHAILSDLLPPDLAGRSARAAAELESAHPGLPGAWCELAAELHEAAGDRVRAARLLLRLGGRALDQGALSTAITSLADAHDLLAAPPAEPMLAIEIDQALVDALAHAGDYRRLIPVAQRLIAELDAAGADPRRQALAMITVARVSCEDHCSTSATQLSAARAIADRLHDTELASRVDAAAAHCAIDSGDLDGAEELARRALASAEAAGSDSWAAEVAFESLEVIGRRERQRDIEVARAAFTRAYQIAADGDFAIRRIRALHQLGTIDMLVDGSTGRLSEARKLASKAGAVSTATVIDLQLANTWSLGTDLDRALEAARRCEQGARQIAARRTEAIALNVQALVAAIRTDRTEMARAAERAEKILPGDPEVLFSTWGLARVTASLFHDDLLRALQESEAGISYGGDTALMSPRRAWGYHAILQATFERDGHGAIERARAAGAAVGWNQGYLAFAEAVLEGRDGHRDRASALAGEASALLAPYAPWWNHLARRLVAPSALEDGWGEPAAWLREAAADFEANGHPRLASACRGLLRRAGERVPRSGRGSAQVPPQMRRLGITSREMDVFLLVARGFSNAEIARRLYISPKTVETHIASLVAKTGQTGRRELVAHAARFVPH